MITEPKRIHARGWRMRRGDKYALLTAVHEVKNHALHYDAWLFRCDCGTETTTKATRVIKGLTRSCGCLVRAAGISKKGKPVKQRIDPTLAEIAIRAAAIRATWTPAQEERRRAVQRTPYECPQVRLIRDALDARTK